MRQEITLQQGIPIEKAREIVKKIKDSKLKVQASIQGDFVRVAGKDRDTLQDVIKLLRDTRFRHRHAVHQLPDQLTWPRRIESHWIAGPAGRLEALLEEPEDRRAASGGGGLPSASAVRRHHAQQGGLPHGARTAPRRGRGAALQLSRRGRAATASTGTSTGEIEDARAALAWLRDRYPALPFALAGFSFGSRVITRLGCDLEAARFAAGRGFPTDYGSPDYLETCRAPKIFIQSTHDQYGPRVEMEALYERLAEPKRLIWIEAADHFFAGALEELERQRLVLRTFPGSSRPVPLLSCSS